MGMNHKVIGKVGFILLVFLSKNIYAQYKVEKLAPEINSSQYDEISPVVTRDGHTLYFTRIGTPLFNRTLIQDDIDLSKTLNEADYFQTLRSVYSQIAEHDIPDPVTSDINQDIWIADSKDGIFDRVFQPGFPINSALPNSVCSLSPDDRTLVIINHFAKDGSMYKGFSTMDRRPDGSFSYPEPIFIHDFYSKSPDVNLCMSKDGDVIILSLNRREGKGDNDLYISFRLKPNLWSEPINLGDEINSTYRELTPFLSQDKTKLFFSSNRPGGIGGADIYVTNRLDYTWRKWSKPKLLPEPINSKFDDSNPVVVEPNSNMYFISRRDGTSDIFRTELDPIITIEKAITIRGIVRNSITNEAISSQLYYGLAKLPVKRHEIMDLPNGVFEIKLDRADIYKISPYKPGYLGKNQQVDVNILTQSDILIYEIDFYLTPLEAEQKIEVNNIYFERGTPTVLAQSFPEIDRLADLLNQSPGLQVRIEGHTDSVGNYNQLLDLSRERAESIKKYLVINKGIGAHRIGTIGYGGTRPISPNDNEVNKARNRRVEIYVTTQSGPNKKVLVEELKDPVVRPIGGSDIATLADITGRPDGLKIYKSTPVTTAAEMPTLSKARHYGNIQFNINQLSIKESSLLEIRKLIDYLTLNKSKKIRLQGMFTDNEVADNPAKLAMQRARGVKEYLIFKSIEAGRIQLQEDTSDKSFPGVKVFVDN